MSFEFMFLDEVDSTNTKGKDFALEGKDKLIVVAEKQTAGRGRFNREWLSSEGGLFMSIVLQQPDVSKAGYLTFAAGLAVSKVLKELSGIDCNVKWPNDVYVDDKKICGILTEIVSGKGHAAVIGIGVNVNQEHLPDTLMHTASSLFNETQKKYDIRDMALKIGVVFQKYFDLYNQEKYDEILSEWKKNSLTLGKKIQVKARSETIEGKAVDVDSDCNLIVESQDGEKHIVSEGDVFAFH